MRLLLPVLQLLPGALPRLLLLPDVPLLLFLLSQRLSLLLRLQSLPESAGSLRSVVLCSHVIQVCNLVLVVIGNSFLLLEHFLEGLLLCFLLCLAGFQVCFLVCELIAVIRYLLYQIHVLLQALSVVFV